MPKKKYTITKKDFIDWLISDREDIEFWGKTFIKELKDVGHLNTSIAKLFKEREGLPAHLFKGQLDREDAEFLYDSDIELSEVKLIN